MVSWFALCFGRSSQLCCFLVLSQPLVQMPSSSSPRWFGLRCLRPAAWVLHGVWYWVEGNKTWMIKEPDHRDTQTGFVPTSDKRIDMIDDPTRLHSAGPGAASGACTGCSKRSVCRENQLLFSLVPNRIQRVG